MGIIPRALAVTRRLSLRRWIEHVWWFDLVYPSTLALTLFGLLTAIVYSGKPSSRLAALAESELLELVLDAAAGTAPIAPNPEILIVSAIPTETKYFRPAPFGRRPEVSAADYARIIDRLAEGGAEYVIVNWDLSAHFNDEIYYLPIIEAATRNKDRTKLLFAVASSRRLEFPKTLEPFVTVLDDVRCDDRESRETFCPYMPDLSDWIISRIVDMTRFQQASERDEQDNPKWLTSLLPSNVDSFALHLPPPKSLKSISFGEVFESDEPPRSRLAFIGADASGATSGTSDSRFVKTVFDDTAMHVDAAGTALHVYWAQIASMFLRGDLLRFPPEWVRFPLTAAICTLIVISMFRFSGTVALSFLLVYGATGFLLNVHLGVPLNYYLPLFDSFYFGLAMVTFASAGRLSYLSFLKWRLQEIQKIHAHTADLKANFLSLVSHNLNTPVAKMHGMISVVQGLIKEPQLAVRLSEAQRLVTDLEFTIRFVLNTVALDEGKLNETPRNLESVLREFVVANQSALKKLGINLTISTRADSPDLLQIPVRLDVRTVTSAFAAMATLFSPEEEGMSIPLNVCIDLKEEITSGSIQLRVALMGEDQASFGQPTGPHPRLLKEVASGLIKRIAETYRGHLDWRSTDHRERLVVTLIFSPPHENSGTTFA
jgi:signal transduction histidine kinase